MDEDMSPRSLFWSCIHNVLPVCGRRFLESIGLGAEVKELVRIFFVEVI